MRKNIQIPNKYTVRLKNIRKNVDFAAIPAEEGLFLKKHPYTNPKSKL